jgi:hypothetical protein
MHIRRVHALFSLLHMVRAKFSVSVMTGREYIILQSVRVIPFILRKICNPTMQKVEESQAKEGQAAARRA